jgi:hypothetical protein
MREFKINREVKWNWSSRGSSVAMVDSSEDISGAVESDQGDDQSLRINITTEFDRYCKIVDADDVQLATISIPGIKQNKGAERLRIGRFLIRERVQDQQDGATNLLTRTIV